MRIITLVILMMCLSCNEVKREKNKNFEGLGNIDTIQIQSAIRAVSRINGEYQIDEEVILNNKNLDKLINELQNTQFANNVLTSEIPRFILSFSENIIGEELEIANRDEDWQSGSFAPIELMPNEDGKIFSENGIDTILVGTIVNRTLPRRKLQFIGSSNEITLLSHKIGGVGVSQRILIFEHDQSEITDFWCGSSLKDLNSKEEIVKFLIDNKNKDWGLNTNVLYF